MTAHRRMAELVATEQEPAKPTYDNPISLSRDNIVTSAGSTEVIKIKVLNPSGDDWIQRRELYTSNNMGDSDSCNVADRVCYVSDTCTVEDIDCEGDTNRECDSSKPTDGVCFVGPGCDIPDEGEFDCGPQDGVDIIVRCDNELRVNSVSNPKKIMSGEVQDFTSIIEVRKGVKGTYLCELEVFGEGIVDYNKDITIEVE